MNDLAKWQAERTAQVTAPAGNLALIGYQSVTSTDWAAIAELPAGVALQESAPFGVDEPITGVMVKPTAPDSSDTVFIDGMPVTGPTRLSLLQPYGGPLLTCGRFTVDAFSLDGSDVELRIYDAQAPALSKFAGIDRYPEDSDLCLTGSFTRLEHPEQVAWDFTRHTDSGHTKKVPGTVHVTIAGADYDLVAFLNGPQLMLVFGDATNGRESYGAGRFLTVPAPAADGTVELDFNYAFIPPCGFSDAYSCPLPPAANRIQTPIRAGERAVVWHK